MTSTNQMVVNSCISSVNGFLASPATGWIPFATAAVSMVIFILVMIYMLAPLIGRTELRNWGKLKIYETLMGLFLILIFGSLATMVCTINPVPAYNHIQLVPTECNNAVAPGGAAIDNIYGLAECDLYNFNQGIVTLNSEISVDNLLISFSPTIGVTYAPLASAGVPGIGVGLSVPMAMPSLTTFSGGALKAIAGLLILSQVQLLLLDSSMVIFAIFLSLGIIARLFGVTRTFGGSMIAFALGIGFVFPLLISISYGFMDNAVTALISNAGSNFLTNGQAPDSLVALISNPSSALLNTAIGAFAPILTIFGIAAVGLLIIPFINFTVLDTFIIDFSKAIGEEVDFLRLLTSIA